MPANARELTPHLLTLLPEREGEDIFETEACAILEFSSDIRLSLALETPLILGRNVFSENENVLDLSELNAFQHGLSRRHCVLRRRANRLTVTDLGSTNGTYLNGKLLPSYKDHVVVHGDTLSLGTLEFKILFSTIECSES